MLIGFEAIIEYIKKNKLASKNKDVYEFGVCSGGGSGQILESLNNNLIAFDRYYGFDSWTGLPEETKGVWKPDVWNKGAFSAMEQLGGTIEQITERITTYLRTFTKRPIDFISGFYENSLTPNLAKDKNFKSALFVSVDVDIHKSAYQVLDYMFENKLIVKGTIIRYDDWGDFTHPQWKGAEEYTIGESLAHKQITEKYNLEFETIYHEHGVKVVVLK